MEVKPITRETFEKIMKDLSESAFQIFFEYSQMAVRVYGASGHRESFDPVSRVKQNDSHIRRSLDLAQSAIVKTYNLNVESLIAAQEKYTDLHELVNVIPQMFTAYTKGEFPVLPASIWPHTSDSDDKILEEISEYFESGEPRPVSLETKNLVSRRINESDAFKARLLQIVVNAQASLRAKVV